MHSSVSLLYFKITTQPPYPENSSDHLPTNFSHGFISTRHTYIQLFKHLSSLTRISTPRGKSFLCFVYHCIPSAW